MTDHQKLAEIREETRERMKQLSFGEPVTNISAGENNPLRHCLFVRYKTSTHTAECTDGKGRFSEIHADSVYSGHLDAETALKLFNPLWDATFGPFVKVKLNNGTGRND